MQSPLMVLLAVGLAAPTALTQQRGAAAPDESAAGARRIALVEQPSTGVAKAGVRAAARSAEHELKALGYDLLPAAQLAAAFGKGKKAPACGDAAECLAGIGKLAGVGYVLNVALNPAGKQFGLKLTLVDAANSKIISNIMSFVARPQAPALTETVKKQVARAAAALEKHIGEEGVLALAAKVEPAKESTAREPGSAFAKLARPSAPEKWVAPKDEPLLSPVDSGRTEVAVQPAKGPGAVPFVLMGVGATAIGIGLGLFGMDARTAVARFKEGENPEAARDRAKQSALLCDITTGAGAAFVLTGLGLVLLSGEETHAGPVVVAPAGRGLAAAGRF